MSSWDTDVKGKGALKCDEEEKKGEERRNEEAKEREKKLKVKIVRYTFL